MKLHHYTGCAKINLSPARQLCPVAELHLMVANSDTRIVNMVAKDSATYVYETRPKTC